MPSVLSRLSSVLAILLSGYIAYRILCRVVGNRRAAAALARAQAVKRAQRERQFGLLHEAIESTAASRANGRQDAIAHESAVSLATKLSAGTYSARLVLHCLLARVVAAQMEFNVISEANFEQAMQDADKADKHLQSTGRPLGRLHGLPISMKDGINVTGLDSTLGLVRFVGIPAAADALVVRLLRDAGAIVHVKSNIPQTLLSFECANPLHGRTLHPMNKLLSPGGSSGGESALLTCGASVLGIGTDIGGSVRIPAHFSGNTALKPTARRISLQGFRPSVPGQEAIPAVAGPMAQNVDDLILVLRELITPAAFARDHELVPLPLDEAQLAASGKLKIGYYVDDGLVAASPACARAVTEAADALRAAGHSVTQWTPPRMLDAIALYYSLITADASYTLTAQLDGEVWEDYTRTLITGVRLPAAVKQLVASVLEHVAKDPKAARLARSSRQRSVAELWALQAERKKYRQEFFDAWTAAGDFDIVLCPVHVLPAVPHGSFKSVSFTASYTMLYNVLDLPAGVLPITRVQADTDAYATDAKGILEKAARACYDLGLQAGMPVGVQVVGRPFKDETVLRAMKEIERLVQFKHERIAL